MLTLAESPAFTEDGLKLAVAPEGRPLTDSVTLSAEPVATEVLICAEVPSPGLATFTEFGEIDRAKSLDGAGVLLPMKLMFSSLFGEPVPGPLTAPSVALLTSASRTSLGVAFGLA